MIDPTKVSVLGDAPTAYDDPAPYGPSEVWREFDGRLPLGPTGSGLVYAAVRNLLRQAGLDENRLDSRAWNPFADFVRTGDCVVLKPNWVRHFNPCEEGTISSVVTHPSVIRAVADYALLAVGENGRVIIADAPQHDCDFAALREVAGITSLESHYRSLGLPVEIRDLRQEAVIFEDGIVTQRFRLDGDPEGYTEVDLGSQSSLAHKSIKPKRLRGADYDAEETIQHHSGGVHRYLVSNTILRADCVINLPKMKSHKKAGITCCLKNLVGINGNKNYLPHHTTGFGGRSGDEFDKLNWYTWSRRMAVEWARKRLTLGKSITLLKTARRLSPGPAPKNMVRAGNWHGNNTIWRTVLDLNVILQYANRDGSMSMSRCTDRTLFNIAEGIVAGGEDGPLAPRDVPAGILVCGADPVRVDMAAAMVMGFDWKKIPSLSQALKLEVRPLTSLDDITEPFINVQKYGVPKDQSLESCPTLVLVPPHFGWKGHIEREQILEVADAASLAR